MPIDKNQLEKQAKHLGQVLGDRHLKAWTWKKAGKTYREIADKLEISTQRVYQLLCEANDEAEYCGKPLSRLSPRYRKVLLDAGIKTDQAVIEGIKTGKVHHRPSCGLKGFSIKAYQEACKRYGVKPARAFRSASPKSIEKAIELLRRNGYAGTATPSGSSRAIPPALIHSAR